MKRLQVVRTPAACQEQIRRRRLPVRRPGPVACETYARQLRSLGSMLPADWPAWQLEGGVAVAAHLGSFRREHTDIDIGVLQADVPELGQRLGKSGFRLFSRNRVHALEYTPLDVLRPISVHEVMSGKRVRRVTAVRVDARGRAMRNGDPLTRFDVHIHRRGSEAVYLTDDGVPFPRDLFDRIAIKTLSGVRLRVAAAPFLYFFKLDARRPRHAFDLELLVEGGHVSGPDQDRLRAYYRLHYAPQWASRLDRRGLGPAVPSHA